jgi:hypothetical protein
MADERAIIARVESGDLQELADVLAAPSEEEEGALRKYLGAEEFEELRGPGPRANHHRGGGRRAQG